MLVITMLIVTGWQSAATGHLKISNGKCKLGIIADNSFGG